MSNQIPIGYEVNQETWDWLKGTMPREPPNRVMIWGERSSTLGQVFIRVSAECAGGFHPVYAREGYTGK